MSHFKYIKVGCYGYLFHGRFFSVVSLTGPTQFSNTLAFLHMFFSDESLPVSASRTGVDEIDKPVNCKEDHKMSNNIRL